METLRHQVLQKMTKEAPHRSTNEDGFTANQDQVAWSLCDLAEDLNSQPGNRLRVHHNT